VIINRGYLLKSGVGNTTVAEPKSFCSVAHFDHPNKIPKNMSPTINTHNAVFIFYLLAIQAQAPVRTTAIVMIPSAIFPFPSTTNIERK